MIDAARSPVSGRALAALGRGGGTSPMPVASVAAGDAKRTERLEGRAAAWKAGRSVQTRQGASRAREIAVSIIYPHADG